MNRVWKILPCGVMTGELQAWGGLPVGDPWQQGDGMKMLGDHKYKPMYALKQLYQKYGKKLRLEEG